MNDITFSVLAIIITVLSAAFLWLCLYGFIIDNHAYKCFGIFAILVIVVPLILNVI